MRSPRLITYQSGRMRMEARLREIQREGREEAEAGAQPERREVGGVRRFLLACRRRKAAALTRLWHVVEQKRRLPFLETSTTCRHHFANETENVCGDFFASPSYAR